MHVAVGFMPAFKYRQKNSLIVLERGHKARGYESAEDISKIRIGCTPVTMPGYLSSSESATEPSLLSPARRWSAVFRDHPKALQSFECLAPAVSSPPGQPTKCGLFQGASCPS